MREYVDGAVSHPEKEWIERTRQGDATAFESLYAAHAGRVKAYFLRSGFASADADDLTQETFLRAYRSLPSYDAERGRFAVWVGTIARNCARSRWNHRRRPRDFDPELAEHMLDGAEGPEASAAQSEELKALRDCLRRLSPSLAALVRLRYVEGRTMRGIAATTGIAESTVRLRLREAGQALTRCMKGKGEWE